MKRTQDEYNSVASAALPAKICKMEISDDSESTELSDEEIDSNGDSTSDEDLEKFRLTARPYQVELLHKALKKNIIVCLGTGTGKTFISVMMIKELAHQIRRSFENGGKRTFFLVNTVPLVFQQAKVIRDETDLKVGTYVGDMGVDFWDKTEWQNEFKKNHILVMTAQIFLDILNHGFLGLSRTNLLVFDECHHAKKEHPFKRIMTFFDVCPQEDYPNVLGLTASVVNGKVKPWKIESEMKQLEMTLRASCETASDTEAIEKYGAKPFEDIVTYSKNNAILEEDDKFLSDTLKSSLAQALEFLDDCRMPDVRLKNAHQSVKFAMRECLDTLKDIGPWSAYQVAGYLISDLERAELFQVHDEATTLLQFCATHLRQFRKVYENFTELMDEDSALRLYMRPKVRTLLNILKQYNNEDQRSTGASKTPAILCGIVFVERRYTALSLSQLINRVASGDAELKFVSCSHVIGHGNAGSVGNDAEMGFRKQEKVLSQFRNHEFNLLIATSVVEEGLDVPKCNCVIRFDFPLNYRSYVQSKGRARAKESRFVILAEEEEKDGIQCQLELYQAIEKYLTEACHDRPSPTEEESIEAVDTDYLPPFMPVKGEGKARLTMSNSIALLCRYCSKLPGDMFTHLMPEFVLEEAGEKAYLGTVHMPTNCPLRRKIVGQPMPQKRLAKMAAAYYACKELFEMKELDNSLLPVRSLSDEESEDEEVDDKKAKTGTKKRRRRYERKVPDALISTLPSPGRPVYLYAIHITPAGESAPPQTLFGLITKKELPTVCPFELFPDAGPVYVTIAEQTLFRSDARDVKESIETIGRFHRYLFSVVLRKPLSSVPDRDNGYYVVLLKELNGRHKIDLNQMEKFVTSSDEPKLFRRRAASNLTEGQVVVPLHSSVGKRIDSLGGGAFRVVKVCHDKSPLSRFPDQSKANTFEEYYRNEYKQTVTNMEQPLVQVQHMSSRVSFLTDRHKLTKKERKAQQKEILFIPELCDFLQIPAAILSEALMLPSVLYRFNSFLLVEQLKNIITQEIKDTDDHEVILKRNKVRRSSRNKTKPCPGDLGSSSSAADKCDDDDFSGKLRELFSNAEPLNIDTDLSLLHRALTTANAADAFDLERLEMLGDAFLKQAVSIFLFGKYEDKDEGRLTKRKIGQISNKALFKMAEPKELPSYMFSTQLDRGMWCPPDLQVSVDDSSAEELGKKARERKEAENSGLATAVETQDSVAQTRQRCTTQEISDKSVADSVEALIGAYLTSCGYLGALKFMRYLGIKVLPEEGQSQVFAGDLPRAGQYAAVPIPELKYYEEGNISDTVSRLTSGFETFEERIKYRFSGAKLYLLQALSHPSYQANRVTGCYQRLEFLGDALLDFLVTQHLYFHHGRLSPGQLTDIRQALVNNNIFATIAVRYGYHKYLKQMSPLWYKTIENFVVAIRERVEEEEEKGLTVTADSFVILTDSNDEGIEAPKVLGDIFESVAGAIFLDSGMDLIKTWKVYYRMMKPYIDHYSTNVPLNPIREVHERDEHAEFSKSEKMMDGKIKCTLKVTWGEFVAKGSNGKMAKLAVSKIALQRFRK